MKMTVLISLAIAFLSCCLVQAEEYKPGEIIIQLKQSIIPKTQQGSTLEISTV